ncbi:hypothetical protein SAMN06295888_109113 [Desulfonatronum zhilinae]|nr:hypothetical protein SAMN06295888_109113 [Desulfonatronum zhilinae]
MKHLFIKSRKPLFSLRADFGRPSPLLRPLLVAVLTASLAFPPFLFRAPSMGLAAESTAPSGRTIVPAWSQISDHDARLELARLLGRDQENLPAARRQYELLYRDDPDDPEVILELAGVLGRLSAHQDAVRILTDLPGDRLGPEQRLDLAARFAALGHAGRSRTILLDLLAERPGDLELTLRAANIMLGWGDFYRAETLLRTLLGDPALSAAQSRTIRLELSATLLAAQRYEQAEGLLRGLLLDDRSDPDAWAALTGLRLAEQDFKGAMDILDAVPPRALDHVALLRLRGQTLYQAGELEAALDVQQALAATPGYSTDDELALARTLLRLGQEDRAEAALASILDRVPDHIEARFLWIALPGQPDHGGDRARLVQPDDPLQSPTGEGFSLRRPMSSVAPDDPRYSADGLRQKIRPATSPRRTMRTPTHPLGHGVLVHPQFIDHLRQAFPSPDQLAAWGALYALAGVREPARKCYLAALELDPDFFPARLGLAEINASLQDYDGSLNELDALLHDLPQVSKLLLTRARVLSWAKRYDDSLAAYDALHRLRPEDPLPLREAARVAMWAKQAEQAQDLYRAMQVSDDLRGLMPRADALRFRVRQTELNEALGEVIRELRDGRAYPVRERLEAAYAMHGSELAQNTARDTAQDIERLLADLLPAYRVQRAAHLEEQAKMLTWNRRGLPALDAYTELLEAQPGNQEALFDLAQAQCSLGLHDQEMATCLELLNLDPLHGRAGLAVERIQSRSRPALRADYGFWNEQGQGGARLSAMRRHQGTLTGELPLGTARYHLFASQHVWSERPGSLDDLHVDVRDRLEKEYSAQGQTFGLRGVLTPWLRGHAAFTRKSYDSSEVQDQNLGVAGVELNLRDVVRLGLEYERRQELSNGLALTGGVLYDAWRLTATSPLTRRLDLGLTAEYAGMSDDNQGLALRGDLGLGLTDHPRELKITLTGEHRHFRRESEYFYDGPTLIGIDHPYWTPRNYSATALTLEWRHDLAEMHFCGARQHWYNLKLSTGTDTDANPGLRLEGEYQVDLGRGWSLGLQGLLHRSRQWDAEGVWAGLEYRF